nr:hypothetical protein [Tanacetum cinerariifolium]GEZ45838.1 hypothetical protein [Tanacetum cinerariifolium]
KGSAISTDPQHIPTLLQPSSSQPQKTQKPRKAKRKDTQVPQLYGLTESVTDEVVYKELDDSLVRVATTTSSLEAAQDSGGGPRCQDTMGDTIAQTRSERVSKVSNDLLLARDKATQALEIDSLKRMVKKLEKKQRSRTHKFKRLYKVGISARVESSDDNIDLGEDASKQGRKIHDIDTDEDITLVNDQDDEQMFDADQYFEVDDTQVQVSTAATTATILIDEVTLDQALVELKHTKPKAKARGIVFHEPEESTTTIIPKSKS